MKRLLSVNKMPLTLYVSASVSNYNVFVAVPFPKGVLKDCKQIQVYDPNGVVVASCVQELARWPMGHSIRSLAINFSVSLPVGTHGDYSIAYNGAVGESELGYVAPYVDGEVLALLDANWYCQSELAGLHVPFSENEDFSDWQEQLEDRLVNMNPPWESYACSPRKTAKERTYYDTPHALYQRFLRDPRPETFKRAREELLWYQSNEVSWFDDDSVALFCTMEAWDPQKALPWDVLRRMICQGLLDDYLLTADPESKKIIIGFGEAYVQNLPALMKGTENSLRCTERNLAWTILGLTAYYALDQQDRVLQALDALLAFTFDWQAASDSGAFEHDIHRPDPDECGCGPNGGSPFMTAILVDALMELWTLTGDKLIPGIVVRAANWLKDSALTSNGKAFQYLWGCEDRDYDREEPPMVFLNLLIVPVFGAAYVFSKDREYIRLGDEMAQLGVESQGIVAPKQWAQAMRCFGKYLKYRTL